MVLIEESEFIQDMITVLDKMEESEIRRALRFLGREPEDEDAFINTLKYMKEKRK